MIIKLDVQIWARNSTWKSILDFVKQISMAFTADNYLFANNQFHHASPTTQRTPSRYP
jgi:hypothetical protein